MEDIGYTRVSTEDQAYEQTLRQHAGRLKAAGATRIYADIGSRTDDNRAGLQEIFSLVEQGKVRRVYITRLDRVTSSPGLFEKMTQVFQRHGVIMIALDENVDLHSIDGEFAAGLQIYFNQREVRTIQLRIKKSYEHRRNKRRANTSVPWGYKVEKGQYRLDHSEFLCTLSDRLTYTKAALAKDIIHLFFETGSLSQSIKTLHTKYGIQKIASAATKKQSYLVIEDDDFEYKRPRKSRAGLFVWSRDGIKKWLKNPVLRGHTPYLTFESSGKTRKAAPQNEWQIEYDTHPEFTLLTEEQYQQITQVIESNHKLKGYGSFSPQYPLTGLLFCGECGRGMKCQGVKRVKVGRRLYYQCKNYQESACPNKKMILDTKAEEAVIDALTKRAEAIAHLAQLPTTSTPIDSPELHQLKTQLEGLEALGYNPALIEAKRQLQTQIANLQATNKVEAQQQGAGIEQLLWTFGDRRTWAVLGMEDKRNAYRTFVSRVLVKDGEVVAIELKV